MHDRLVPDWSTASAQPPWTITQDKQRQEGVRLPETDIGQCAALHAQWPLPSPTSDDTDVECHNDFSPATCFPPPSAFVLSLENATRSAIYSCDAHLLEEIEKEADRVSCVRHAVVYAWRRRGDVAAGFKIGGRFVDCLSDGSVEIECPLVEPSKLRSVFPTLTLGLPSSLPGSPQ